MPKVTCEPDEFVLADFSPKRSSLFFPVIELLLISGVIFLGIGAIDAYFDSVARSTFGTTYASALQITAMLPEDQTVLALLWARRALVVLWLWLAWRRCIRHVVYRSRSRMMLTSQRLITATGHVVRSEISEIPLRHIVDARHRGSEVAVYTMGARVPILLHNVPQAKRFVRVLREQIQRV